MNKIQSSRKYVFYFLFYFILFVLFHVSIWNIYTSKIYGLQKDYYAGDLARIAYQFDFIYKRKLEYTLPKKHINKETYNNQKIDMITIGDSFSNADTCGKNPYYQDFLATKYNKNILNIKLQGDFLNTIIGLKNSGILAKIQPKYILIETVEREIPHLYKPKLLPSFSPKINHIKDILHSKVTTSPVPKLQIINSINYKAPFYSFLSEISQYKLHNAYIFPLQKEMFSSKIKNKLIVYKNDINNFNQFTKKNISDINNKLNKVAFLLQELHIKLIFMPVVDKYNLYYKYIINPPYPRNPFFKILKSMDKKYIFINTEKILSQAIEQNVKDLYYPDDTHWSFKASDILTNSKIFQKILSQSN